MSQGAELETQWAVSRDFRLLANVSYLDSHYVSYHQPRTALENFCAGNYVLPYCSQFSNPLPAFHDAAGESTAYAPKWSGSVTASYSVTLAGDYQFTTALSPYFTSSYNPDPDGIYRALGDYMRLDARLTLAWPANRWAVDLIGKNLTNRLIETSGALNGGGHKEKPRILALQFRRNFGR